MIAVGSDRGCPSGTTYIVGSSPTCLGLILLRSKHTYLYSCILSLSHKKEKSLGILIDERSGVTH